MQKLEGVSVSTGIAIGTAVILKEKKYDFEQRKINDLEIPEEIERYRSAVEFLCQEIDYNIEKIISVEEDKHIIEAHKLILSDPEIEIQVKDLICKQKHNLEYAVHLVYNQTISFFEKLENEMMAERSSDYKDVYHKLINYLTKRDSSIISKLKEGQIIVSEDISPSMISKLVEIGIKGIVLQKGARTSHSVIIARAMNLPIITGIYHLHKIHDDDRLILDAGMGLVIVSPNQEEEEFYIKLKSKHEEENHFLNKIISFECLSADSRKIHLMANIELPIEIDQVRNLHADGIGLFRTEFFYINRSVLPSEEEQFNVYKLIGEKMKSKPVIIRTIDVGGDKMANWYPNFKEDNPYLGCRGIRFSLKYPNVFKTQIKAILRASHFGNIQIMFPLISSLEEFMDAKNYVYECMRDLQKNDILFNNEIKIGTMIEIPSAALLSDSLAKKCDFFSIGTNDLLQYTLAVDRNNENVHQYYNPFNPAFIYLIMKTVESAKKNNIPVAVCGELAGDEKFIAFLLALGIEELSVSIYNILKIKQSIRSINISFIEQMVSSVCELTETKKMEDFLEKLDQMSRNPENILNV